MKHIRGFTLLELIVVIAIIGILSVVILPSFKNALARSRDATRLADMANIEKALRIYNAYNGNYPPIAESDCGGWDDSNGDANGNGKPFIEVLADSGLMPRMPVDPSKELGCSAKRYRYYVYTAGSYGCDPARGDFFVLGVTDMEGSSGPYPNSPGRGSGSCTTEWYNGGLEWYTLGYTK